MSLLLRLNVSLQLVEMESVRAMQRLRHAMHEVHAALVDAESTKGRLIAAIHLVQHGNLLLYKEKQALDILRKCQPDVSHISEM